MTSVLPSMSTRPEELQTKTGREILALLRAASLLEHAALGPNVSALEVAGRPGALHAMARRRISQNGSKSVNTASVGIVMMRGGVMHIGGQPYRIADAGAFHERQEIGDLVLAPLRRTIA